MGTTSREAWVSRDAMDDRALARAPRGDGCDAPPAYSGVLRMLVEENAHLRAVLGRCPKSIAVLDEGGRIRAYNDEFGSLFERAPAIGEAAESLFDPEDRARLAGVLRADAEPRAGAVLTLPSRDGRERDVELVARTLTEGDRALGTVLAGEDRTATLDEERERARLAHAVELANRRSAFSLAQATLCHDLGNAVTSALLAWQALAAMSRHGPLEGATATELITRGLDATHHAAQLVSKGRDAERRSFAPVRGRAELSACVARVLRVLRPSICRRTLQMTSDVEAHVEVQLTATELAQVLTNLVRNAIQAVVDSGHAGTVRVWSERGEETDGRARIHVQDDGVGIEPSRLKSVFDAFDAARADRGAGIDLAIAHRIVESAGGRLHAVSTVARGTDMILELPLAP